jgi:PAS domain S-box-containing protein
MVLSAAVLGGLLVWLYFQHRLPPVPPGPLRIGFESNPPVQVKTVDGFSGLAVEAVGEAARRAGIELQWVETGASSYDSFQRGLVDLWPLMVNLPERRKLVYFTKPWVHSARALVMREGAPVPDARFTGNIAVFNLSIHVRVVHEHFPRAHTIIGRDVHDVIGQMCSGAADAAFVESRTAVTELRNAPEECAGIRLRVHSMANMMFHSGIASTYKAAGAAEKIEGELEKMFADGTLATLIAKYSFFGLDDTWASYQAEEEVQTSRWVGWSVAGVAVALGLVLWQAYLLRSRKKAEAELRESEERFRTMADSAPVLIWVSGTDKRCTFFNKGWLDFTGRTMEQVQGDGWAEDVHPDDFSRCYSTFASAFDERRSFQMEYRLRRADGEYRWLIDHGVPRFASGGDFSGYIGSCIDITDLKRAQEEAVAGQKLEALGVLANGIAHDFNNLLGSALTHSELAQAKLAENTTPEKELRQIQRLAVRGAEIVRQLMMFAGSETDSVEFEDISAIVSEMAELLKVSISKHAVLITELGRELPKVQGRPAQLRQIVMNLVTNASEAIGECDGVIRVSTRRLRAGAAAAGGDAKLAAEEYVELEVSDTGGGMSPETKNRLFEPFFTTKSIGRGMGLTTVNRIVQRHAGSIEVQSELGRGTTIRILLPSATGRLPYPQRPLEPEKPTKAAAFDGTVLVVEDESTLRFAVSSMLQRKGFTVLEAGDGTAALELIRSSEADFSAMLLDLTLPGASSRDVFEEARRLRPDLRVIFTSAYGHEAAQAALPGLESSKFIRKPFTIESLVNLLCNSQST